MVFKISLYSIWISMVSHKTRLSFFLTLFCLIWGPPVCNLGSQYNLKILVSVSSNSRLLCGYRLMVGIIVNFDLWFGADIYSTWDSWFAVTSKIVGFPSVCRYAVNWSFSSFEQENKNQFLRGGAREVIRVKMWNWQDANNSN